MTGTEASPDGEYLREVLLDLERARQFERDMRRESEGLLAGLKILALDESSEETFTHLLQALQKTFLYKTAFIISVSQHEKIHVLASTHAAYQEVDWQACDLFRKTLLGEPLAVFNLALIPECQLQGALLSENCHSLLMIPLKGLEQNAILLATHSEIGFFAKDHLHLAKRFALLASQALRQSELKEQLRYQQEFNRMILNALPAMVYVQDEDNDVIMANQMTQDFLEPEQLSRDLLAQEFESQEHLFERALKTKDGTMRWFHTALKKLLGPHQEQYILGVSTDISLNKEAESALEQAMRSAEQSNQAKSRFLATISHELRTPMNAILGFSKILLKRRGELLVAKNQLFLERIYDNARHLLELINEILDISRIEAGQLDYRESTFDVVGLLQEVFAGFEILAAHKHLNLSAQGLDSAVLIKSDRDKLNQIVANLLSNAIKFTPQGEVALILNLDSDGGLVSIDVKDTGIGIEEKNIQAIFEPFYQVDSGTQRFYPGVGLGLSITRDICQFLNLELKVSSQIGVGTHFQVCF